MHSFLKLKPTWELLPNINNSARIRDSVRRRVRKLLSKVIYPHIATSINRSTLIPYSIVFKPDSHCILNDIPDYSHLFELWINGNMRNNCGDMARLYAIYQNVHHVLLEDVPGDIVELGVYKGNSAAILARLARERGRQTYLFDTFSGFDSRDLRGIDAGRGIVFADTTLQAVQDLVGTESVTYVKGFFPQSIAEIKLPRK